MMRRGRVSSRASNVTFSDSSDNGARINVLFPFRLLLSDRSVQPKEKPVRRSIGHAPSARLSDKTRVAVHAIPFHFVLTPCSRVRSPTTTISMIHPKSPQRNTRDKKKPFRLIVKKRYNHLEMFIEYSSHPADIKLPHLPYSKSYSRRSKRKAKERLAGNMEDLLALLEDEDSELNASPTVSKDGPRIDRRPEAQALMIREGKGATLSASKRKKTL